MSNQTKKNILFLAGAFDGHIPSSIQVLKDLISLGHSVTCYVLDKFENRLKVAGVKLKPVSIGKIVLPEMAPPIAIYGFMAVAFYYYVLTDVKNSNEKYDYFFMILFLMVEN